MMVVIGKTDGGGGGNVVMWRGCAVVMWLKLT